MTYVPVTGNVMSKFIPAPVFPSHVNCEPSGLKMYVLVFEVVIVVEFTPSPSFCPAVPANMMLCLLTYPCRRHRSRRSTDRYRPRVKRREVSVTVTLPGTGPSRIKQDRVRPVTGSVISKLVPVPAPPCVNTIPSGLYMYMLRLENVELFTPNPTTCPAVPSNTTKPILFTVLMVAVKLLPPLAILPSKFNICWCKGGRGNKEVGVTCRSAVRRQYRNPTRTSEGWNSSSNGCARG